MIVVVGKLDGLSAASGALSARDGTLCAPETSGHRAADVATESLVDHRLPEECRGSWGAPVPTLVVPKVVVRPSATEARQGSASPARVPQPAKVRVQVAGPPTTLRRSLWLTATCLVGASAALAAVHTGIVGHPGRLLSSASMSSSATTVPQNRRSSPSPPVRPITRSTLGRTGSRSAPAAHHGSSSESRESSPVFAAIVEPGRLHRGGTCNRAGGRWWHRHRGVRQRPIPVPDGTSRSLHLHAQSSLRTLERTSPNDENVGSPGRPVSPPFRS